MKKGHDHTLTIWQSRAGDWGKKRGAPAVQSVQASMQASLQNQHELSICNINDWCDCYPMLFTERSAVLYIANYSVTKVES